MNIGVVDAEVVQVLVGGPAAFALLGSAMLYGEYGSSLKWQKPASEWERKEMFQWLGQESERRRFVSLARSRCPEGSARLGSAP